MLTDPMLLLSPRKALQNGYSNASVVPSIHHLVCHSHVDPVNTIETEMLTNPHPTWLTY